MDVFVSLEGSLRAELREKGGGGAVAITLRGNLLTLYEELPRDMQQVRFIGEKAQKLSEIAILIALA